MYQTTIEHFQKKLESKFPNENFTVLTFTKANEPTTIKCNICNHIYTYNRGTTLYSSRRKYFCKLCNTNSIKNVLQACKEHDLDIIKFGDKVTDSFTFLCNTCGTQFSRTPSSWIKYDCPECGINKKIIDKNIYQNQLDNQFGKNELIILDTIPKSHLMTIQHTCGFIRTTSLKSILQSKACPFCDKTASLGERKILSFLEQNHIDYVYQKKITDTHMRFDFFLEQYNLAIEFNGIQHYMPVKLFGGEERFKQQQIYDKAKSEYCLKHNIDLLIISYTDFNNIDTILTSKLKEVQINEY